jgi:3-oxoadipate enol-lactonase
LPFDWRAVTALSSQLEDPDPAWWDRLIDITAPTLLITGGSTSHVPQDKLAEVARRIPCCAVTSIPVGHKVHEAAPREFIAALGEFVGA